jgi:MFS family permease
MLEFVRLLKDNRNYRYTWMGQVVSEIGDHFNNIAVFSLVVQQDAGGVAVTGVMLARAIPAITLGPLAGVLLDRMDRKRLMLASDLIRGVVAAGFILTLNDPSHHLIYILSALLMAASPFFTAGRSSILPTIATKEQLLTANSLTQTTQWSTLTLGAMLGGMSVAGLGYDWAFFLNAMSFLFSAWCISMLRLPEKERPAQVKKSLTETDLMRPWHEYVEGLRYMRSTPLLVGIAVLTIGWASGGGAAQILFSLFGEKVFHKGAGGIGTIWAFAGMGLLLGGAVAHRIFPTLSFASYKRIIVFAYLVHGLSYVVFSQMKNFWAACAFMLLSRAGVAVSAVSNYAQLFRHVPDQFRGRVFATIESLNWSMMMLSMLAAGVASSHYSPRTIGAVSGILSSLTAFYWLHMDTSGRLPEPPVKGVEPEEIEIHEPTVP